METIGWIVCILLSLAFLGVIDVDIDVSARASGERIVCSRDRG